MTDFFLVDRVADPVGHRRAGGCGAVVQSLAETAVVKFVGVAVAGRRPGEAGMIGWLSQTNAQMMIECAKILLDRQGLRLRRSTRCC